MPALKKIEMGAIPHISTIEHLREAKQVRFKEEVVEGCLFTIVSYMVTDNSLWSTPFAKEARGVTFDHLGNVASRPFEKFFNVGECESTQMSALPKTPLFEAFEKVDGSMVTPVVLPNGGVRFKTKKSFFSEVAVLANQDFNLTTAPRLIEFIRYVDGIGCTPIFEYTTPDFKIVVDYGGVSQIRLLAIRKKVEGEYLSHEHVVGLARDFKLSNIVVPRKLLTLDELKNIQSMEGIEGYVVLFENGQRVKFKTRWYLSLHRICTSLRVRDIAEMVLNESFDDIIPSLISKSSGEVDIGPALAIQKDVSNRVNDIYRQVEEIARASSDLSIKEIALKFKGHPLFNLILQRTRGRDIEVDVVRYFRKKHLHEYPLKSLYNKNF